jgi:pilus assembly protein Flp/PilA
MKTNFEEHPMSHPRAITGFFRRLATEETGITSIEYGILAAGVAVVVGALVSSDGAFSTTINELFQRVLDQLPQAAAAKS